MKLSTRFNQVQINQLQVFRRRVSNGYVKDCAPECFELFFLMSSDRGLGSLSECGNEGFICSQGLWR